MTIKYDKIGVDYNLTRKADPFLMKKLLEYLEPDKKGIYLDIGCGTGNYTNELQKTGLRCIGIDPSKEMLDKAKLRNNEIQWQLGSADATGLPDKSVDGIIGFLTIHHWADLKMAFSELGRVLKPTGTIVIFSSTPDQMKGYWLNHYFPKMMADSMSQMPDQQHVETAMAKGGISSVTTKKYNILPHLRDKFLYCGKYNPESYFNKQIRQGISSFSSLANRKEVKKGLSELRQDIDSGKIHAVIKSYENDLGDYRFFIGKR